MCLSVRHFNTTSLFSGACVSETFNVVPLSFSMAQTGELVYTVLEVLIAVACCLGNLLVIWAVWTCGAMRRQPTFCFIVSLAVADFLVGAVAVPVAVLVDGQVITSFNGCLFLSCMLIVLTQASVHSLLAIALDRFLRVYIPLR